MVHIQHDRRLNPNGWLKWLKRELGIRAVHRLLAMAASNDPFNKGTEGDRHKAEWFRNVYEHYGYPGIDLRSLHYRMVSLQPPPTLWDGQTQYINIERHWEKLQEASTTARILGTVEALDFSLNPNAVAAPTILQRGSGRPPELEYEVSPPDYRYALPRAQDATDLPRVLGFTAYDQPAYEISGYDYSPELQPNVVEIWTEKAGSEHAILRGLAYEYGINYVPGRGFASLTATRTMLKRLEASGKPGRILYVSDFDPAGQAMPVSVARHCQFACWELEKLAGEVAPSIKVDNVVVTREQVEQLDLPRIPIKETDTRKARFELTNGVGAVEVNALEAIHPGELRTMLRGRIEELRDADLTRKVEERREEARSVVVDALNEVQERYRARLEDIAWQARNVEGRYRTLYEQLGTEVARRYQRLAERFERHVAPLREELETVEAEIRQAIEDLDVDLPELPEGETNEDAKRAWLFDSGRDFLEQTEHFRRVQGKE